MMSRRSAGLLVALTLSAAACSRQTKPDITVSDSDGGSDALSAEVASYDLVVNRPARFVVGVFANDNEHVLAYGTARLAFRYLGTKAAPIDTARPAMATTATFIPIPGQRLRSARSAQLVPASQAMGVYGAPSVSFDTAGFWSVRIDATAAGKHLAASSSFQVNQTSTLPAPGSHAPATRQALAGAPGVSPTAIDSRAGDNDPIPDPELHNTTIADALAAGRPMMIVVSTPTYCQSRFCGPITDAVAALAKQHPGPIAFIHLEIWQNFDKGIMNPAAARWILPADINDAREPWVFTVGGDGIIRQRFDNVASEAELEAAVQDLTSS